MTSTSKPFIDDPVAVGLKMHELCTELYPICRSITGNGVRQTLDILSKYVDIQQFEIPSGKRVFDWTVPNEWNCDDAYYDHKQSQMAMLWMLAYSDRKHTTRDIERMSGMSITDLSLADQRLVDAEQLATLSLADE